MRVSSRLATVTAAGTLLLAGPVFAQGNLTGMITGADAARVAQIASVYGPAEVSAEETDPGPVITAEIDGIYYSISFLNCDTPNGCSSLQLRAWWASSNAHSLEAMNTWNRDRRWSAAYLDRDNNATIEYDVNLAGGITAINFDDTMQWWDAVLREFRAEVIDPGYAAAGITGSGSTPTK
jgi:hypothetical protein